MRFEKAPTTIDEQIALLQGRGMTVASEDVARRWLETVGYYRLSSYWLPFEATPDPGQTRSKTFPAGTTFERIVDLYTFDRKLRLLVTEALERVEIAVRARWTNRMVLAHGPHAHVQSDLFDAVSHARRLAALADRVRESREVFVEHYKRKYDDPALPPLWMVSELMTFGELSKWVEATVDVRVRSDVARDLGLPTHETLTGTLQLLTYVRNICADHGRLRNRRTVKRLPNIKRFRADLQVDPEATGEQRQLSNQIYNVLTVLVLLLRHQADDTTFPARLHALIETLADGEQAAMGFPGDWQTRSAWLT